MGRCVYLCRMFIVVMFLRVVIMAGADWLTGFFRSFYVLK